MLWEFGPQKNMSSDRLIKIGQANAIIEEVQAQGYTLSLARELGSSRPVPSGQLPVTDIEEIITDLRDGGVVVEACGSRVTCNPPPTDTDQDYLVECNDRDAVGEVVRILDNAGFKWEGDEHYRHAASNFMSWRRGDINLIVTSNSTFAQRHRIATQVCTSLNLLKKEDRITLFKAILYKVPGAVAPRQPVKEPVPTEIDVAIDWLRSGGADMRGYGYIFEPAPVAVPDDIPF